MTASSDRELVLALAAMTTEQREQLHDDADLDAIAAATEDRWPELAVVFTVIADLVVSVGAAGDRAVDVDPGGYVSDALGRCSPVMRRVLLDLVVTRRDREAGWLAGWWATLAAFVAGWEAEQRAAFAAATDDYFGAVPVTPTG